MNIKENQINEIDKEIIALIKQNDKKNFEEIIEKDGRVSVLLALSKIRENIINWFPFKENCTILEIGANFGEITETLCNNAKKVVSYEIIDEKREAIKKRHDNLENLILIDSLEKIEEKFDYITLIGIEKITDNVEELIINVKNYLKPDGKILLATNNNIGLKSLFTYTDDNNKIYNLDEWIQILDKIGFGNIKIYYPMTDYKITNVIYTDKRIMLNDDISRNIVYNDIDSIKVREENNVYSELLKSNIDFKKIANSFFIEIFNGEYEENNIRLVAFSNMRKDKYKIKTIIHKDFVSKHAYNEYSIEHINNVKNNIDIMAKCNLKTIDSYNDNYIISKCVEKDTLDTVLIKMVKNNKEETIALINKFKKELIEKLYECDKENNVFDKYSIQYDNDTIQNMKFTNYGLWDLIFQNCFYIDNEFYFYDQEWMEEKLPINFIFYRVIKYFKAIQQYISKEELYNIFEINLNQVDLFEELDNKLQEKIRNNTIWQFQKQGKTIKDMKIQKLTDNHTINLLNIDIYNKNMEITNIKAKIENKNEEINELKNINIKLQNEIYEMKNSKSWKVTKPFRRLRGHK